MAVTVESRAEEESGQPEDRHEQPRRWWSAVPRTVWLITAAWCTLLLGASVVWPMSYGIDEPRHIDMAYEYASRPFTFYGPGQLHDSKAYTGLSELVPGWPPQKSLALVPIPSRGSRPTFAELGGHQLETTGPPNQMVQHPPLYYELQAVLLRLPGVQGLPWDMVVWLMRLLSVAFMAPVPLLCWAAARRFLTRPFGEMGAARAGRLATLAAAVPLTIPDLIRDGASVDNDSLLILSFSVCLYLVVRVMTGDHTIKAAATLGVALLVSLLTKGMALVLPPLILLSYLIAGFDRRNGWTAHLQKVWRPVAVVAVGGVLGGIWWLRNLVDYGSLQPNGYGAYNSVILGKPDNKGTFGHFLQLYLFGFLSRIWGEIAIPDPPTPGPLVVWGWFALAVVGTAAALLVRGRPGQRRRMAVLALALVGLFAIPASQSWKTFRHWSTYVTAAQGRYIYAGILALALLTAVGWMRLSRPRLHSRFVPIVIAGAIATNAAAWIILMRSWYRPPGGSTSSAFNVLERWSPLPSAVTILLVVVLPLAACLSAFLSAAYDSSLAKATHR